MSVMASHRLPLATLLAIAGCITPAFAQPIVRESKSGLGAGVQGNGASTQPQLSNDTNSIVFRSLADNWPDGSSGVNATRIIRRNRLTGAVTMISGSGQGASPPLSGEVPANGINTRPSYHGASIAYTNDANSTGLQPCPDSNNVNDIYVGSGSPQPRTTAPGGFCDTQSLGDSDNADVSPDGSHIAFDTFGTIFSAGDTATRDVYTVTATGAKTFSKKSVTGNAITGVTAGNGDSSNPALTVNANGTFTAFESLANNLIGADGNGLRDIFLRIEPSGIGFASTQRVSADFNGGDANGASFNPAISADGQFVVFSSDASDLLAAGLDTNGVRDVFIRDVAAGTTKRLSKNFAGVQGNAASDHPVVSADGTWVAFESASTNLAADLTTTVGRSHIYLCHVPTGSMFLVSFNQDATVLTQGNGNSFNPSISPDGLSVAFESDATNLETGLADTNGARDVYVYSRPGIPSSDVCGVFNVGPGVFSGSTAGALPTSGLTLSPIGCGVTNNAPDAWYTFTADCTGPYRFSTAGSSYDTTLALLQGGCGGVVLACNDDFSGLGLQSQIDTNLTAGQIVAVRVAGFQNRAGDYTLTISYTGSPPANDTCAAAQVVLPGDTPFVACGATDDGAPVTQSPCLFTPHDDVWFAFTPPSAGTYIIETVGINYDTTLTVYQGASCPPSAAFQIACNDDYNGNVRSRAVASLAVFPYRIRIGAFFDGNAGQATLRIRRQGCNLADITQVGGTQIDPGQPDNQLTVDDIIVFINSFSDGTGCPGAGPCNPADITQVGGTVQNPGDPEGELTVDDIIVFFNAFSDGC